MKGPRVLVFGCWDEGDGYPRTESLLEALRRLGVSVNLWQLDLPYRGKDKKRLVRSPWLWPKYWLHLRRARGRCVASLEQAIAEYQPDALLVPYPGHLIVHWAREVFAGPIVLDLFLSAYDTVVEDRRMFRPKSMIADYLRRMDQRACEAASLVLLDTPDHAKATAKALELPRERFGWVPVTDSRAPAHVSEYQPPVEGQRLEVLFFGTGVPLHGLEVLLQAIAATDGVRLTLVGGTRKERRLAAALPAEKIDLRPEFVPLAELHRLLEQTHLVAGVFGTSPKAGRVVPFKVVHALAAGRPVITADTPAIWRMLRPGKDCIIVPAGDVEELAAAFQRLVGSGTKLAALARHARDSFAARFSMNSVERRLGAALTRVGIDVGTATPSERPEPTHV